jgi:hypothetical protein
LFWPSVLVTVLALSLLLTLPSLSQSVLPSSPALLYVLQPLSLYRLPTLDYFHARPSLSTTFGPCVLLVQVRPLHFVPSCLPLPSISVRYILSLAAFRCRPFPSATFCPQLRSAAVHFRPLHFVRGKRVYDPGPLLALFEYLILAQLSRVHRPELVSLVFCGLQQGPASWYLLFILFYRSD